ncbi:hypothetical protein DEU56DRAFT_841619 [Suillus clintonianus]|uniref:uncharacterized protein n=1 Tax=Suillus clintonianus TaxID=1904413 RepID=UPI001B86C2DB|nr:uncharacterized protein DEU56DRAFT_841619 [Suillus clintonianus]KAG2114855.1 hypothetical protein DEU56DRAFT_841619 [Suillus clintonianus]
MSLKPDRRNRSWINRFLASLRRVFMSEPPPGLQVLKFHCPNGPDVNSASVLGWCSQMADFWDKTHGNLYAKCVLARMEYYKCTGHPEHEFLLFYFRHWIDGCSAQAVVSADRAVQVQGRSLKQSSEIVSPSSSNTDAYDSVSIYGSPRDAVPRLQERYAPYSKLCTFHFPSSSAPSALQVSIVLSLVHRQAPAYHLYENQCYWFSSAVWGSLKELFPSDQDSECENHRARSRYRGVALGSPTEGIEAVCAAYQPEWQKMLEMLEQVKCHHEAEEEKNRQKWEMEREVKNEPFRKAQEAEMERIRQAEICAQAEVERVRRAKDTEIERKDTEIERVRQAEICAQAETERVRREKDAEIERVRQAEICAQAEVERVRRAKDAEIERRDTEIEQLRARLAALDG